MDKNSVNIINKIAPGIPNIPTTNAVPIFKPIWKPKFAPIRFIKNIIIPPTIEFPINFNIPFNGQANILPNIKIDITHTANVIKILLSKKSHLFN